MTLCGARVARLRQDDGYGLTRHELGLVHCLGSVALDDDSASVIAVGFSILEDLFLDECLQTGGTIQRLLEQVALFLQLLLLPFDLEFLELGKIAQTQV